MAMLRQGSTGQDVRNLQTALNYHLPKALPPLKVDGIFGPRTHARVRQFQNANRLSPDGIVGPETHEALYSFVTFSSHLLVDNARQDDRFRLVRAVGDAPPQPPSILPPLPRLQLPFPQPFRTPPVLQPPRLEIDPRLLLLARRTDFELEAGQQTSFITDLGNGKTNRELVLFADVKATLWSKPIGKKLKLSAGGGVIVEKRARSDASTETHVYVFTKAETVDILTLGPLDIAKIEAEAQAAGKLGGDEPPEVSASITGGPEVEMLNGRLTIGPKGFIEYKFDGRTHVVGAGGKLSATLHF